MKGELIFGINPVRESLRGTRGAFNLYVQTKATDHRVENLIKLAEKRGVPVHRREKADLTSMCASSHHQGIALEVEPFRYADLDDLLKAVEQSGTPGFLLVLDGILDPHNLGALIRSAACAGVDGVVIPKDRACGVTAAVEKASSGAVETIPVAQVTNIAQSLEAMKKGGYWVYGLTGEAADSLFETKFAGSIVLVIGGEGEGIRPLVRKQCDVLISIPRFGGVSSLNASVAGGIAMFDVAQKTKVNAE
ncbi:MAG: 23S rRNA (guanosine(2251)-2'-O)-methyltransferase RlmB [Desulfuromonadales bacterium]